MLTASVASVLLDYPSSWQQASSPPAIPALTITHELALAPAGNPAHAGLLAGGLPGGEPSPLPAPFVELFQKLPRAEIVNLLGNQAYRYAGLSIPGFPHELTLYGDPKPGRRSRPGSPATPPRASPPTCARANTSSPRSRWSASPRATTSRPTPAYARALSASVTALDQQRTALRRQMSQVAPSLTLQRAATQLAGVFAHAAEALSPLEPSLAVGRAQAALAAALVQARAAYEAFATAVGEGGPRGSRPPGSASTQRKRASTPRSRDSRCWGTRSRPSQPPRRG